MTSTVFHFTDSTAFGGAEQALLTLMAGQDRRRWRPVLVCPPAPGIAPLVAGAHKLDIPVWTAPPMPEGRQGAFQACHFVRELLRRRPLVFHAHLTWPRACKYGLFAAVLARVPAVIATEQLFVEVPRNRLALWQQRLLALGVGCFIAVSNDVAQRLHATYHVPKRKIRVIPNAIPVVSFRQPIQSAGRLGIHGGRDLPIILTVARLDKQKGHQYLLAAAAQVPNAFFVLAGDGDERRALEAQSQALGLGDRVLFLGYRQDIPELLAGCDLFVLPSLYEGLPISVLEAMAAGRPVIATAIGGTNEAVDHGESGWLVPPGDPAALAVAIRTLLAEPGRAQRLAEAGRQRVQREFSAETMVQRVTEVYDQLLGAGRPAP